MGQKFRFLAIMIVLIVGLTGCGEVIREPDALISGTIDLTECSTIRGTVLDASGENLFLRADDGSEYVFSLLGVTVKVEDRLEKDLYVEVFYSFPSGQSELKESNSKRAHVVYVQQIPNEE
ncbi:hypothetical protein [uncultured Ruthenibacterium sp.]|uniref:hypothetical protein n=1 Tax=uncultured Ruthenibacterium sp. TaxID=1905347 RepID=UPI00349E918D